MPKDPPKPKKLTKKQMEEELSNNILIANQ